MTDIAWAAGLFEGEGSISTPRRKRNRHAARLSLSLTDEDVLRRFHSIVGVGQVYGPYRRGGIYKDIWRWQVGDWAGVLRVLRLFGPYFGVRRGERAALATERVWKVVARFVDRGSVDVPEGTIIKARAYEQLRAAIGED